MNIYTKQYIHEVKALFPSKGKKERDYLKKLRITIDEYCEEEHINNKQAIYEKYGKPIDIVYDYYSALDTEVIVKKIRLASFFKIFISVLVLAALLSALAFSYRQYQLHLIDLRQEMVGVEEEIIVTGNWDDDGNPIPLDYNPYADSVDETVPTESLK